MMPASATSEVYLDHFRARVIQDAFAEATADYWRRRGVTFEAARPRRGDFHGHAARADLQRRQDRLTELAAACRAAAQVAVLHDHDHDHDGLDREDPHDLDLRDAS